MGLPWHCMTKPQLVRSEADAVDKWVFFTAEPHVPAGMNAFIMTGRQLTRAGRETTFEGLCADYENAFALARHEDGTCFVCDCCAQDTKGCSSCTHALGWHRCDHEAARSCAAGLAEEPQRRWRAGTLHNGRLDVTSTLWTLARRLVHLHVLKEKLNDYIAEGHFPASEKDDYVHVFEQMQGVVRQQNLSPGPGGADAAGTDAANAPMTEDELRAELSARELLMQTLRDGVETGLLSDQWRVYSEIVEKLMKNEAPLRLFMQASAGTGKSFLIETVCLWCLVHGHDAKVCAPTGIAAARVHVPRTSVRAVTLHHLFALNVQLESKIDLTTPTDERTAKLAKMTVLIVDEAAMVDDGAWDAMVDQLTSVSALPIHDAEAPRHPRAHMLKHKNIQP
jgi:hypothetical protein